MEALEIVDRALRKIALRETIDTILDEVARANENVDAHSDWVAFANARVRVANSSVEELEKLDELFKSNRVP